MGTYHVQPDGTAPEGLEEGDKVVTDVGTYTITGFDDFGKYLTVDKDGKQVVDKSVTTQNYTGAYDDPPGQAAEVSSALWAMLNSSGSSNKKTAAKNSYMPSTLSFAEAMKLAERALTPQYQDTYQQAATAASQSLDKAGLYNTLYGQALKAAAQNEVTEDLNAAINTLALQLQQNSRSNANEAYSLYLQQQQQEQEARNSKVNSMLNYLNLIMNQ